MRDSIKVIKFTAVFSVIFMIITYLITVNMEIHFFELNTIWLSNNFVLTSCGGIFASFFVVFLCEVQKYLAAKSSVQAELFYHATYLYTALFYIQQNIREYRENKAYIVPDNLLDMRVAMVQGELSILQNTDYCTFKAHNRFVDVHRKFCSEGAVKISTVVNNCNFLKTALYSARTQSTLSFGNAVTSANPIVDKTLSVLEQETSEALLEVDTYLQKIDTCCKNRYNWGATRTTTHSDYVSIFTYSDIDDFLKKGE